SAHVTWSGPVSAATTFQPDPKNGTTKYTASFDFDVEQGYTGAIYLAFTFTTNAGLPAQKTFNGTAHANGAGSPPPPAPAPAAFLPWLFGGGGFALGGGAIGGYYAKKYGNLKNAQKNSNPSKRDPFSAPVASRLAAQGL